MVTTKDVMQHVKSKVHAAEIMVSIKFFYDKAGYPFGAAFAQCVRLGFLANEVPMPETLAVNVANSLVGKIERKSKIPFTN